MSRSVVILTVHGEVVRRMRGPMGWSITDGIVVVSKDVGRSFLFEYPMLGRKTCVIYNGIAARVHADRGRIKTGACQGICVARLDALKGINDLVRGVAECKTMRVGFDLSLVGDGPCRGELEGLVRSLDLSDEISFLGWREDVPALLMHADMYVLASYTEGMPLSILEAMAAGLPVVATAVGGVPELVQDGVTGLLVPPRDPQALAGAMSRLVKDPALRRRMGEAGRRRVEEHFSFDRMVQQYEDLYRELLARRRG